MTKRTKKTSELSDAELTAIADDVEAHARDRSRWQETPASKAQAAERERWVDAKTTSISIRVPNEMLEVLRALAAAQGMGYQTLIKRWLHDRILVEARERQTTKQHLANKARQEQAQHAQNVEALASLVTARR